MAAIWNAVGIDSGQTTIIGMMTMGLRIHHGYMGIVLGLVTWTFLETRPPIRNLVYLGAIGLFVSEMVHHFFVLWPITGSPQFDPVYS